MEQGRIERIVVARSPIVVCPGTIAWFAYDLPSVGSVAELTRAAELAPRDYDTRVELGLALSAAPNIRFSETLE